MLFQLNIITFVLLFSVCEHSRDFHLGTRIQDEGQTEVPKEKQTSENESPEELGSIKYTFLLIKHTNIYTQV